MKLDKILNFKKVRCVKAYDDCLKIGKEYDVIDVSVEIKVKDTGIGVAPEHINDIFKRFYRVNHVDNQNIKDSK